MGPVLCIGPVAIDLVVEGFAPSDPEKLQSWTGPATVRTLAAGSIGYAALSLTALGRDVDLVSCVGDDAMGAEALAQWERHGVSTGGIQVHEGESNLAIYLRLFGDSKRPMVFRAADYPPWPESLRLTDLPRRPSLLVVSGALHFPTFSAEQLGPLLRDCRELGIPTVLDPQFAPEDREVPWSREFAEILELTDVLCCDEREGAQLFGSGDASDIIERGHAAGCRVVVVKREHLGAVLDDGVRRIYQPAVSLGGGIGSTIGSGDAFLAGLTSRMLDGAGIDEIARWATAVATLAITHPDGIRGISVDGVAAALTRVPRPQVLRIPRRTATSHHTAKGTT
ncbi:ribokinase [soil metagenome]